MSWFKKEGEQERANVEHDSHQEVMFYNPDPMCNRLSMVLRLSREIEFCLDDEAKAYLKEAMETLLSSIEERKPEPVMH